MSDDNEFQRLEQRLPCRSPFDLFAFRFFYSSLVSNFINFPYFFLWTMTATSTVVFGLKQKRGCRSPSDSIETDSWRRNPIWIFSSFLLSLFLSLFYYACVSMFDSHPPAPKIKRNIVFCSQRDDTYQDRWRRPLGMVREYRGSRYKDGTCRDSRFSLPLSLIFQFYLNLFSSDLCLTSLNLILK